jgi:hypothetical protein
LRAGKSLTISGKQVKVVKIAQRQLDWSEDEYQSVLERIGVRVCADGRRSCKDMTQAQFEAYIRHAERCGFDLSFPSVPPSDRPSKAQMYRLHELTNDVLALRLGYRVGSKVNDECHEELAARKFVEGVIAQATSGKHRQFWSPSDAARAIEALQRVFERQSSPVPF